MQAKLICCGTAVNVGWYCKHHAIVSDVFTSVATMFTAVGIISCAARLKTKDMSACQQSCQGSRPDLLGRQPTVHRAQTGWCVFSHGHFHLLMIIRVALHQARTRVMACQFWNSHNITGTTDWLIAWLVTSINVLHEHLMQIACRFSVSKSDWVMQDLDVGNVKLAYGCAEITKFLCRQKSMRNIWFTSAGNLLRAELEGAERSIKVLW